MSIASDEGKPESDTCAMCVDAKTIVLPTGERYRVCAPNNWKSYECAAKQLVALKKPAAHAELAQPAKPLQRG
jgi:hypothetical protein